MNRPADPTGDPHYQVPAELMRAGRTRAGLTQVQLADRWGIGESTVRLYERKGAPVRFADAMLGMLADRGELESAEARAFLEWVRNWKRENQPERES